MTFHLQTGKRQLICKVRSQDPRASCEMNHSKNELASDAVWPARA